ncbi:MAG: hypothetical protein DI551_00480 [Micavibrio aeruginosavorus]|uniref:Uncharacterized protein n=1 Tax=Micavibrio aeruginosavorus TaxID=349221 RepID=A0A2W5N6S6_9BACT|nr:MAG: hypothetical protein DI551_00480 [Micavibrio aeruginosavorus]
MGLDSFLQPTSVPDLKRLDFNIVYDQGASDLKERAGELLSKIHADFYCPYFPIESEREAVEDWQERLFAGKNGQKVFQYFTAYGRGLEGDAPQVVGFTVSEYYAGTQTGLVNYTIRDSAYKGRFSGREMCSHHVELMKEDCLRVDDVPLMGVLSESNDPERMLRSAAAKSALLSDAQKSGPFSELKDLYKKIEGRDYWDGLDCMDPSLRLRIAERNYGVRQIGIDYAQAPLTPSKTQEERLQKTSDDLFMFQFDADHFSDYKAAHFKKFLVAFSRQFAAVENPRNLNVPSINRMMDQVDYLCEHNLPLLLNQQSVETRAALARLSGVASSSIHRPETLQPC